MDEHSPTAAGTAAAAVQTVDQTRAVAQCCPTSSLSSRLCVAVAPSPAATPPSKPQSLAASTAATVTSQESEEAALSSTQFPEVVELNVGGHFFTTRLSTLRKDADSMLAAMFSGRHRVDRDSGGRYFIDRDGGECFAPILNYLRHGELPRVERALDVYREALYYNLSGLISWCETQPNVIAEMMFKHAREWLGPAYEGFKNKLLESARKRFTTSPEAFLDDKTGYFDLTFAFTRPDRLRPRTSDDYRQDASACTNHVFGQEPATLKYDAVLPPGLDFDMTLNFLRRDFHEAGLTTEWSPVYSDKKSTCTLCHMRIYFVYFRVVLWHWVTAPLASPAATSV
ncbi:uncharacterized protein LOC135818308 [Sycon ciliatum]|uniref:uncharacterized protein LOC135818308 n=1 Tax=Sycon ciliatum TaxID=27933 RepID=UPI0031F5FE19